MQNLKISLRFFSYYIVLLFFFFSNSLAGQNKTELNKIDSLSLLEYSTLYKNISEGDSLLSVLSLNAYLKKGKSGKDSIKIIKGYRYFMVFSDEYSQKLKYSDTIINITNKNHYGWFYKDAMFFKAISLYETNDYENALHYFIKVKELNKTKDIDEELDVAVDINIGIIKNRLGYYKEALKLFNRGMILLSDTPR
jgi:tetratricopeptide (TPR) repeat protein